MKTYWHIVCSLSIALLTLLSAGKAQASIWNEPADVNELLTGFETPVLSPGEEGVFALNLTNSFPAPISNITLLAETYLLAYPDHESKWEEIEDPPSLTNDSFSGDLIFIQTLDVDQRIRIEWDVLTTPHTSRGDWFSQATYFIRLLLIFDEEGGNHSYASRGFFDDVDWDKLTENASGMIGGVNQTYLKNLGYEGIIPESSLMIRDPIPLWPVFLMLSVGAISFIIATYYHLEKEPASAVRIWAWTKEVERRIGRLLKFKKDSP